MNDITSMLQNNIKYIIILFFILSCLIFTISIATVMIDSSDSSTSDNQNNITDDEFHSDNIDFFVKLDKLSFIDNQTKQKMSNQHIHNSNYASILNSELSPDTPFQNISQTIIFGSYESDSNITHIKNPDNIQIGFVSKVDLPQNEIQNKLNNQTNVTKTYDGNTLYLENEKFNLDYVTLLSDNTIAMSNSESYINTLIDSDEHIDITNSIGYNDENIVFEFKDTKILYDDIITTLENAEDINDKEKELISDLSNTSKPENVKLYKNNSILKYEQEFNTLVAASGFNRIFDGGNYQEINIDVSLDSTKVIIEYNLQNNEFNQKLRELSDRHHTPDYLVDIREHRNNTLRVTIDERHDYDRINIINRSNMETIEIIENNTTDENETEQIELDDGDYIFEGVSEDGTTDIITSERSQDESDDEDNEIDEPNNQDEESDEDEPDITSTTQVSTEETDDTIIISVDENEHVEEFRIIDPDAISHRMNSNIGNSEEYPKVEDGSYRVIGILEDGSEELIKTID